MTRAVGLRVALAIVVVVVAVGAPVAWWFTRTDVTCGVVIDIDQASITDIRSFSLRTAAGVTSSFAIVPARLAPTAFVPGHLREHRALGDARLRDVPPGRVACGRARPPGRPDPVALRGAR